jgi:hypothetical protein
VYGEQFFGFTLRGKWIFKCHYLFNLIYCR